MTSSTASVLLDRLQRAKAVRPGQWMTACPCCESKKGRPLSVTEKDDGRVLVHAFCGCSTEDVLGRLGLTVSDLFPAPVNQHVAPSVPRVPAGDVLAALSEEATTLVLIANDLTEGRDVDWSRLATCAQRIAHARDYINERNK